MEEGEGKLVLSLDAGWFESCNVFSQLYVIDDVLHMYEFDKGLPDNSVKAYEVFDMIIGTGSGGLLAAMLGPLKMTTQEALVAFHAFHKSVFNAMQSSNSEGRDLVSSSATVDQEVLGELLLGAIRQLLEQRLGKEGLLLKMKDIEKLIPSCKFAVTAATAAHLASPTVFRGYRSRKSSPDATLLDALRATLANARLFPPVTFGDPLPSTYIGADSGHPNPIDTVVQECEAIFRSKSIATILSIGSGRHETIGVCSPSDYPEAMIKLISSAQAASERAISRFSHHPEAYYRFEVDQLSPNSASAQESVEANSRAYFTREDVDHQLNALVSCMCLRPSTIRAEELGRPVPGGLAKEVKRMPTMNSTYDNLKMLTYAERASFNPNLWMLDQGPKPSVLWLEGVFGSGKSFVAHSVAVEADRLGILGSSFFMTPGTNTRELENIGVTVNEPASLKNIISSLIVDLGGLSQTFRWNVGEILERKPRLVTANPSVQLTELLLPSLPSLSNDRTFLWVIDGFDEIMRISDRDAADSFFSTLCASFLNFPSNFIIFITSRPHPNHPIPPNSTVHHVVLDLSSPENSRDLDIISYAELKHLGASNRAFSVPPAGHELTLAFRNKAGGHPLWLRVVREHLLTSLTPNEELQELLKLDGTGSSDYDQLMTSTYSQVIARSIDLSNSRNRKALRHVILLLLALQRPLSLSILLEILDGSDELPSTTFRVVTSHLQPLLLGFGNTDPLEFIHLSLRDFFASSPSFGELIQDVPTPRDLAPGHSILLRCAFQVMGTHLLPEVPLENHPRDHPALAYVVASWPNHMINLTSKTYDTRLNGPLSKFLGRSFIPWLEYHPQIGLPFLFTLEFLRQVKPFTENIWNDKVLTRRRTVEKLDELRRRFEMLQRFHDWVLCSTHAVDLWRAQARSRFTDTFFLYLSMENHARGLDELAMNMDALAMSHEAVNLCRSVGPQESHLRKSEALALLLTNFSTRLSVAGRHADSLSAIEEALSLYRQLAHDRPKDFNYNLALSLNNFSNRLSDVGRQTESLAAIEEAVSLYRELVQECPTIYDADLALSLTALSSHLFDAERRPESLTAVDEAVSIYRDLALNFPKMFEAQLALSLINFSQCLLDAGRHAESLATVEEAVSLYRRLIQERPKVFEADLARSLTNLSKSLSGSGKHTESLAAIEESVFLFRQLIQERGEVFEADLAHSLTNLADRLLDAGKTKESLVAVKEAILLRRQMVQERPKVFEAKLAVSLISFSHGLSKAGRHAESLNAIEEAVSLYRHLALEHPKVFTAKLIFALTGLSNLLSEAGRETESIKALHEIISLFQQHTQERRLIFH